MNFMLNEIEKSFIEYGYEIINIDFNNDNISDIDPKKDIIITMNSRDLLRFIDKYKLQNITCYDILIDHPLSLNCYHIISKIDNYIPIVVDTEHKEFLMKEYNVKSYFIPLGGTKLNYVLPYRKKIDQICFMGLPHGRRIPGMNLNNDQKLIFDHLVRNPDLTMHQSCNILKIDHNINFTIVDKLIRGYFREQALKELIENDIPVAIMGSGWDANIYKRKNVTKYDYGSTKDCLNLINSSKLTLNVMPWFKDGGHDRLFNAYANNSLCLTDKSKYLIENFKNKKDIVFYDLKNLKRLPELARYYLDNPDEAEEIADAGMNKVLTYHLWKHRTKELIDIIERND